MRLPAEHGEWHVRGRGTRRVKLRVTRSFALTPKLSRPASCRGAGCGEVPASCREDATGGCEEPGLAEMKHSAAGRSPHTASRTAESTASVVVDGW